MDKVFGHNISDILLGGKREKESKEGEKERESNILSTIHGVSLVGIRWANNQSSYSRLGLCMGTKNEGFHRRSEEGDLGKSDFSGLGGVLKTSFGSIMLQEVGILPTLVYSYFCGLIST